ncbi:MAG: hypothetical protein FJW37_11620, partial [Acidobacteria bacterium]|nr:hypothetical protein [Acidobacteriota bacterium]
AAQKFFETHDDAYDYLVILNNQDIPAASGAVAYELTVRNFRSGYGDRLIDIGREFGSRSRLQSVINLGQLSQYPRDPNAPVPKRLTSRDTPLTVVGHEVGHLFLAYASVRDVGGRARPMLGVQDAHWAFTFNSEASLLEGNRIQDSGDGVSPRFSTTATVQGFSPLDQYLMGLRAPEKVPPTFFVAEASVSALRGPQAGVSFDGRRVDVTVQDLIAAVGRRTPDHTIAQRSFRLAFILVVRQGSEPSAADLEQVDTYRREFENFFAAATGGRATADTSLRRGLRLSSFPAAGVVEGRSAAATVSIDRPASAPLTVLLRARNGLASVPASVTIPAGALSAAFDIAGLRAGVEELAAEVDSAYEIALARIQVAAPASLRLVTVSGDRQVATPGAPLSQPIVLRVTGANDLRYPGAQVRALPSSGSVVPELAVADSSGLVSFRWTPGTGSNLQLQVRVEGPPSGEAAVISARSSQLALSQAVNAASFAGRIAPGGLATIRGTNLAPDGTGIARLPWPSALNGVQVLLNGRAAPLLYVSESQINFLLPEDTPVGQAEIVVAHSAGRSTSLAIQVAPFAPAIFFDPGSGFGAVLVSGSSAITSQRPARRGEFLEIYCTGLGGLRDNAGLMETVAAPEVSISGAPARVVFSGLTPGVPGLYQVNAQVPDQAAPGVQKLVLTIGGILSNEVNVAIE